MQRVPIILAVSLCAASALGAQEQKQQFEVASIRQNLSGSQSFGVNIKPGGNFTTNNYSLVRLVQLAYEVSAAQVDGGPDWVRNDRFDIVAKAAGDVNREQLRLMLKALLAERFALRLRNEKREMPLFELTLARSDGRVGPNLHDCSKKDDTGGVSTPEKPFTAPRGGTVSAGACAPMSNVASLAAARLQGIVQDRTGLAGQWRYNIYFGPDLPEPNSANPDLPSFVTALGEQLGLRLERTRGAVDVLVIESAEKPGEN